MGLGLDDIDVVVEMPVGILAALGHVGDELAVRRPRRQLLVVRTRCQQLALAAGDIEQIQMLAAVAEVADAVFLELVALADDRQGILGLLLAWRKFRIERDHRQVFAVRRPYEILDAVRERGQLARFAAMRSHQPDLCRRLLVSVGGVALAIGQEREPLIIGRPLRPPFAAVGRVRQADAFAAVEADAP